MIVIMAGKTIKGNIHITVHNEDEDVPIGGTGGNPPVQTV